MIADRHEKLYPSVQRFITWTILVGLKCGTWYVDSFFFLFRRNNWFSNGFPLVLAIDNLCWFLIPMRERKNDPVLIGFHENLLLNNGNLLSTLDRLNGKELQIASFGWKPGCCVSSLLHSLSMWYLLPRKFTGPRATIKLRDGKQYQHQSSPYILFNFIFLFFFCRVYFVIVVLFISPFLRGFNSIDRSDSKEQRNSSLSLHSNCNNSQCARCTVHTVFRSLTLCCLLWKKNLLLCVCCTHNKRI